jgi:hypothetical protein
LSSNFVDCQQDEISDLLAAVKEGDVVRASRNSGEKRCAWGWQITPYIAFKIHFYILLSYGEFYQYLLCEILLLYYAEIASNY